MLITNSLNNDCWMAGHYSLIRISYWHSDTRINHLDTPDVRSQAMANYVALLGCNVFRRFFIISVTSKALARFEGVILVLHLFGFFAVLVPLVHLDPHGDSAIFITFLNEGNWSTQALSFFVGLPAAVYSLIGSYPFIAPVAKLFADRGLGADSVVHVRVLHPDLFPS